MTYDLEITNWSHSFASKEIKIKLLKEILGYTNNEAKCIVNQHIKRIVFNLSMKQVEIVSKPFLEHDVNILIKIHNTCDGIDYNDSFLDEIGAPKDHYYDEPVIGREYLGDAFSEDPIYPSMYDNDEEDDEEDTLSVECPYCHSTNVKKISNISKAGSVALFGIFAIGKVNRQWKCNNCKSEF